jgi:hypothetical protein
MSTPTPPVIPQPFASDAGPSFINTIPDVSADPQLADYQSGFKPLTFQPVGSGGVPPLGQDFNGILNAITAHLFALQGGSLQAYDVDVATAIGGYNKGAIVSMANGEGYWINLVDDNATDPEAGGAGWQPIYMYGSGAAIAVTGGSRTLDAVEAARPFLLLTGTLSGNQQIVLPNAFRHWLVINACVIGAFTLTVKTAAGTGVVVPAGGAAAPTAVYCDTVDIYRVFTPSALPTSVTPTPDSIVLRDNLGVQYALTAPLADATERVATTEFVNCGALLAQNGWMLHPNGLVEQWGFNTRLGSAAQTVTFPIAFPNAIYNVVVSPRQNAGDALGQVPTVTGNPGLSSFQLAHSDGSVGAFWRALGR